MADLALRSPRPRKICSRDPRSRETSAGDTGARQARDAETDACETALRQSQTRDPGPGDTHAEAQALVADFLTQTLAALRGPAYKTLPRKNG